MLALREVELYTPFVIDGNTADIHMLIGIIKTKTMILYMCLVLYKDTNIYMDTCKPDTLVKKSSIDKKTFIKNLLRHTMPKEEYAALLIAIGKDVRDQDRIKPF